MEENSDLAGGSGIAARWRRIIRRRALARRRPPVAGRRRPVARWPAPHWPAPTAMRTKIVAGRTCARPNHYRRRYRSIWNTIAIRPTMKADAAASSHQNHIGFGKFPWDRYSRAACLAYGSLVVVSRCGAGMKNQMPPNRSTRKPTIARPPKNVPRPSDDIARPSAISWAA